MRFHHYKIVSEIELIEAELYKIHEELSTFDDKKEKILKVYRIKTGKN